MPPRRDKQAPPMSFAEYLMLGLGEEREPRKHSCGRCATPFGPSAITCPNDRERVESERLARIKAWKQAMETKEQR